MGIYSDILLTVDYDRTLTAPDSTIPERNIAAIREFTEQGGAFTVNTGRSIPMARAFIGKVPLSAPLILYNGSALYDAEAGKLCRSYPIQLDPVQTLRRTAEMFPDLDIEIQALDGHYLLKKNRDWELLSENSGCPWGYVTPETAPLPLLKFAVYGDTSGHSVSSMYRASEAELARMEEAIRLLKEAFGDAVEVFHPCAKIVDVHAKGVSKIRAARDLQKDLGRKLLVCVGDAQNDVPMLRGADFAYCPADAIVADQFENVCKCADGAIADVIYKKIPGLIEKRT